MTESYEEDIPLDLAQAAHQGTSFVPEKRAEQERRDYATTLRQDREALSALADTPEKQAQLVEEFARYRAGFRARFLAELAARSRCVSTMIAGPANFPVARMEKRNRSADRRGQELREYRERALKAIRQVLCPEERPVMSGDEDAVERLREKVAAAEAEQARMKAVNAALRKAAKAGPEIQKAALAALGLNPGEVVAALTPDAFGSIGHPDYEIRNNGANVRRMKQRLEHLERTKAQPVAEAQGSAARLEDDPPANRVRLYFPGKPPDEVRARLKRAGFRFAPSTMAWQAYRNSWSIEVAKKEAGLAPAGA